MTSTTQQELAEFFRTNVERTLNAVAPNQIDITPATKILEKRREMRDLETGLVREKDDFRIRMEMLGQRREELHRKELMLRQSLTKFDTFLKDNDAKRNRANKKANDERKIRDAKEYEITLLKDQISELSAIRTRQEQLVVQGQIFQQYLESIVEATEGYTDIRDILLRYDTLAATNTELLQKLARDQSRTATSRSSFQTNCESSNTAVLNMNNAIAAHKLHLDELKVQSINWQAALDRMLATASAKSLEVGQIRSATANLFNLVKMHLTNRVTHTHETVDQLDKIQQFIMDLAGILAVAD